jgi:hypothetical protein
MTIFQLSYDPNRSSPTYGITLVQAPGQKVTDDVSEFPQINLGPDENQWVGLIQNLFVNWALTYRKSIIIQVTDNGNCSAWMV